MPAGRLRRITVFVSLVFPSLSFAQSYTISILAENDARFRPERFGPSGQIAGRANVGSGLQQAAIWQNGQVNVLDQSISWAFDLNSQGQVVGNWENQPTVWNPSRQSLGSFGFASATNETGEIVGTSWSPSGIGIWPTRWTQSGGTWTAENLSAGGTVGGARDVNESGIIVGSTSTIHSPSNPMPAVWTGGNLTWLDTQGSSVGIALRINELGSVVGWVESPTLGYDYSRAFLWQNGASTNLGALGSDLSAAALGINNFGDVVGWSGEGYGDSDGTSIDQRAILWSNGTPLDLNALIAPGSGWHLSIAKDIDDSGRIVGRGIYNGILNGFMLTPVPEPSTLFLFVVAALGSLRRGSKRTG